MGWYLWLGCVRVLGSSCLSLPEPSFSTSITVVPSAVPPVTGMEPSDHRVARRWWWCHFCALCSTSTPPLNATQVLASRDTRRRSPAACRCPSLPYAHALGGLLASSFWEWGGGRWDEKGVRRMEGGCRASRQISPPSPSSSSFFNFLIIYQCHLSRPNITLFNRLNTHNQSIIRDDINWRYIIPF